MRIYWYWPSPHLRPHPWPPAATRTGDQITVHSLVPPKGQAAEPVSGYTLRRELPRPSADHRPRRPRWWVSRSRVFWKRARLREEAIRSDEFDVCHIHHLNLATDWWAIPRLRRHVPVVATVHDVLPHVRRLPSRIEDACLQQVYRAADALVVYHDTLRTELANRFSIDPTRVLVIPHPIRAEDVTRPPPAGPPTVLFFGTFRRNKGIQVLLETIRMTPREQAVRFLFAGKGEPALEQQVREAALDDERIAHEIARVSHERRTELIQQASLLVLPYTDFHSQSGVLADAYAHGRPVVVTDVGALGSTVREDDSGWVVPPRDAAALVRAIQDALRDERRRHEAAEAARRAGHQQSYEVVGTRLRSFYDEVVSP